MRKLVLIGLVGLAALAGWQIASPWMAMDTLRDAARENDREGLEQNIDFPALRQSVKSEMYDQIETEARRRGDDDVLASIGTNFAKGFVDGTVDAVITPGGMSAMLVTGNLVPREKGTDAAREIDWGVRWVSFNSFHAVPESKDGKPHPSLIFRRDGWSWKLAGIDIPDA
jgi:hypothetical protein